MMHNHHFWVFFAKCLALYPPIGW